jgi:hypothetical protein
MAGWAVDCITHLSPASPEGCTALLVAVCCWSKFVVAVPLPNMRSGTLTALFHSHITCMFGVPTWVRVDSGNEFRGDFEAYCLA